MKAFFKYLIIIVTLCVTLTTIVPARAQEQTKTLKVYLFHSKICPHCVKEIAFLNSIASKYPTVDFQKYELTTSSDNLNLFVAVGNKLNQTSGGVPFLVIGNEPIVGFNDESTTGAEIGDKINAALANHPQDVVAQVITETKITPKLNTIETNNAQPNKPATSGLTQDLNLKIPVIGNVNLKNFSLPLITLVVGLLDGFNPCSMWVLLFLISLLIGMNERKKMWILGSSFIIASGVIYYLFMAAWLNAFLFLGYVTIIRYIIGLLSLGMGIYYLRDYWIHRKGGCATVGEERRQKIFETVKDIVHKQSLWLALGGIITLAVVINAFELLCSAGLPALYTKILSMSPMPKWEYYAYLLLYIFFYLLDNIIVFVIAMVTFEAVGIKNKYMRYSRLIGGVVILLIGILMLFQPGLLMFS